MVVVVVTVVNNKRSTTNTLSREPTNTVAHLLYERRVRVCVFEHFKLVSKTKLRTYSIFIHWFSHSVRWMHRISFEEMIAYMNVCVSWVSSHIQINKNIFWPRISVVWCIVFFCLLFVDFHRLKRKKDRERTKDSK